MMKKTIEILAPCGDEESFFASINNGADAIYLGLGDFNARAKSTFFTTENLRKYVRIAHLFNVKVYITTNTILLDEEIDSFIHFAKECVKAKVDAFIIQDLAVAEIFKQCFTDVVLHASTQLGIHNVAGAKMAKSLGFSRVVLSRESKLDDILAIKKETNIEIEYFVQGALCVSFSGNCYLSEHELGKSGNRGKCAQLCRLPYTAMIDNKVVGSGYLLSARDLCLIENLAILKKANVDSLKIEGRLRRAGYVAQCVKSYKSALENLNTKFDLNKEKHDLKKVFSRGDFLTRAYLDEGTPDNVINPHIQNHLGIEIGKVVKTQPFKDLTKIWINSSHAIHSNDGLKLLDGETEMGSLGVGNVEKINQDTFVIYSKTKVKPNYRVFLTLDSENEKALTSHTRKLAIDAIVLAKENSKLALTFKFNDCTCTAISEYICPPAASNPTSFDELYNQVSKLNDTNFVLNSFDGDIENVFIPKSIINQLRRDCAQNLEDSIINSYEQQILAKEKTKAKLNYEFDLPEPKHNIYYFDEDTILDEIKFVSPILAFTPQVFSVDNVLANLKKAKHFSPDVALNLPIISNEKDCKLLSSILSSLPKDTICIAQNLGHIELIKQHNLTFITGEHLNIGNSLSASLYHKLGASEIIFSKEFPTKLSNVYKMAKGNKTLMNFAHCPFKTIFNNNCKNCKFSKNLQIIGSNQQKYYIKRYRLTQCYFTMKSNTRPEATQNKLKNVFDFT